MKKLGAVVLCCLWITAAEAGGFAATNLSASAVGAGNAVVAASDDVSAAAYNPAGLAWQDGIRAMLGIATQYRDSSVDLGAAGIGPNLGGDANLGHFYLSWMPHESDFGVSLAYNRPYEVENDWGATFPGIAGKTKIKADRLSLDVVYRASSSLAFAAGGDWYVTAATLTQATQYFSGRDKASFGGHLGMKWKPAPTWSLGAMARLGATAQISSGANQTLEIRLPDEVTVGVAHELADAVRLELDVNWSRWSRMKDLNVNSGATVLQSNPLDMKDSVMVMAGVSWFWRENTPLRFGYVYDQAANSRTALHPALADQSGHKISLGAGGDAFGVHGDLAYTYTFYPHSTASGTFAGTYRDRRHAVMLSVSKVF